MSALFHPPSTWVLADDRPGNVTQGLGVAEALGWAFEIKRLEYTAAAALPNFVMRASFGGLTQASRVNLTQPWPELVIAAGRRTAPVAKRIKELAGGACRLVQVMHPGEGDLSPYDLVVIPRHDLPSAAPNVLAVTGAPHRVTADKLAAEAARWREVFAPLPRPWIAVLVGGSTKRRAFTEAMAAELGRTVEAMAKGAGGSLLVTTSRRTGDGPADALFRAITPPMATFRWGDEGDNPFMGYLALADVVVVTGESVSMCSEACATPAPVYVYAPPRLVSGKYQRLHKDLFEGGFARPLAADTVFETWTHPPLNPGAEVARAVRRLFDAPAAP